jgi:hypothetical protein
MTMKRSAEFDPARAQMLLAYIRQGGFPFVAADAAGVPPMLFVSWLRRSERPGAREPLRGFAGAVRQAVAHARLLSELTVCKHDPKFWLSHGPGRERPDCTGWAAEPRPTVRPEAAHDAVAEARTLCSWLLDALTAFPEARAHIAQRLTHEPPPGPKVRKAKRSPQSIFPTPPRWSGFPSSLN